MKEHSTGKLLGTTLFIDIRNFFGICEVLKPKEIYCFVMRVIEPLAESVQKHHGYVCQVQGDAIMAVFDGTNNENHAEDAVECALDMQSILDKMNPIKISNIRIPLSAKIGLCTGEMYACYINIKNRREYTVLGKSINLASRYQQINKYYDTKILIDDSVFPYIKKSSITRKLDKIEIEGCAEKKQIYEVFYTSRSNKDALQTKAHYEKGLACYFQGDWDAAIEWFSMIAEDKASYTMIKRCQERKAQELSVSVNEENKK